MTHNGVNYTLLDLIDRHCINDTSGRAIAFRCEDQSVSFAELQSNSRRIANSLHNLGIEKGDRVALLLSNRLEWINLYFGIIAAGAVAVPINILLRGRDVNQAVVLVDAKAIAVDEYSIEVLGNIDNLPAHVLVVGNVDSAGDPRHITYMSLLHSAAHEPVVEIMPTDPAMMYFTSGTTGAPKGAVHTHETVLWNTFHQVADLDISVEERFLIVPSLTWGAGLHDVTLALMWLGGQSTILPTGKNTLDRIVDAVCRDGITRTLLVPTLLKELLKREDLIETLRASRLVRAMSGAEPLYRETTEALAAVLPQLAVTQTYGMTEFPMIATVTTPKDAINHPGKAGRPSSIISLAVRTADGQIATRGAGEIVFRSPATTIGYLNAPEKNAETFRDGWFHSGDLGIIDEDGYLTVTGRLKDMIVSGGLNIYPREIESLLSLIPGALEVAVVGKPHDRWGEVPVAVIVKHPDSDLTPSDVLSYCAREISGFRCPKEAIVTERPLPKTVTGKIRKMDILV